MSDPYQYLDATGVIVPDTSDLLTEVQDEYTTILPGINTAPETPQGIVMQAQVLARAEVVANNAALANQINPNIAGGIFLDAICALTGFDPPVATASTVLGVTVTGVAGVTIPTGSQAKTAAGDIFQTTEDVELDGSGNGVVDFQAVEAGPVPCAIGALDAVVSTVFGWETVYNSAAATLGTLAPSDAQLRLLRNNTLALQGSSLPEAITSALAATPGVQSYQFRENITNATATIDGVSLVAHSVWAGVQGGTDPAVATALLSAKSGGANWNGSVTVAVVDPSSGQTYNVKFDRPTAVPIKVRATVKLPNSAITSAVVTQALLDYAAGLISGQPGFVVGGSVSPFDLAAAIVSEIAGVYVNKVEVTKVSDNSFQTTEIVLTLEQIATLAASDITVVVT